MPESKHAAGINAALFKALSHPLQGRIMVLLTESEASPKQMADRLGEPLDKVAYHVRSMAKADPPLLELVRIDPAKRGTQKVYKAIARPILEVDSWERLPRLLREVNSVWVAQLVVEDLREAIEAQTFDARVGRTLLRVPRVLDEQAWEELEPAAMRYLEEVDAIAGQAADRLAESGEKGFNVSTVTFAIEMPPAPEGQAGGSA